MGSIILQREYGTGAEMFFLKTMSLQTGFSTVFIRIYLYSCGEFVGSINYYVCPMTFKSLK